MPRTRPWEVSDELWEQVRPLIPPAPSHAKGGRPRLEDRRAFLRHRVCAAHRHPMECAAARTRSEFDGA